MPKLVAGSCAAEPVLKLAFSFAGIMLKRGLRLMRTTVAYSWRLETVTFRPYDVKTINIKNDPNIISTIHDSFVTFAPLEANMKQLARSPREIGHAIRLARKDQGLTQKELASKSGVWQETISKIETGSSGAKLETIFNLLAALDLEITIDIRSKGSADAVDDIF
ncbi:MAG: helix-turn-helix domain-containing protein [Rhodobacteraceae bacterium]|nr:helix-turn-helix domain-containing protein [Paracoccaceae bacterium]